MRMRMGLAISGAQNAASTPQPVGNNYYISPTGNDSTGTGAQGAPWLTTAPLATAYPSGVPAGTNVYLDTDNGAHTSAVVVDAQNGSALEPITITKYGSGARAQIRPATTYTSGWVQESGNIYRRATIEPVIDTTGIDRDQTHAHAVWDGTTRLRGRSSLAGVTQAGDVFYDTNTNTLYVWAPDSRNMATTPGSIVVSPATYNSTGVGVLMNGQYLTVNSVDVEYTAHYGIGPEYQNVNFAASANWSITNCVARHQYHDNIAAGGNNVLIDGVTCENCGDFAIATLALSANLSDDGVVRNFTIDGAYIGCTPEGVVDNWLWEDGTIANCERGAGAVVNFGAPNNDLKPTNQTFRRIAFTDCTVGVGLSVLSEAAMGDGAIVEDCTFSGGTVAILADATGATLHTQPDGTTIEIRRNLILDATEDGIRIENVQGVSIDANGIEGCGRAASNDAGIQLGANTDSASVLHNSMSGCQIGLRTTSDSTAGNIIIRGNAGADSVSGTDIQVGLYQSVSSNNNCWKGTIDYTASTDLATIQGVGRETNTLNADPTFSTVPPTTRAHFATTNVSLDGAGPAGPLVTTDLTGASFASPPTIGAVE